MLDVYGNIVPIKTKSLGIPYMGSKRKYADTLLHKMLEMKPEAKYFYDLFGGGGAMSFCALQHGLTVHYNEINADLCELMRYVTNPTQQSKYGIFPEHFYDFIEREKFFELRTQTGLYAEFVRVCYSFGNSGKAYAFGTDVEPLKKLAHNIVIYQCEESAKNLSEEFGFPVKISRKPTWNERRLDFRKDLSKYTNDRQKLQIERLEGVERIQKLEELQELQTLNVLENHKGLIPATITGTDYKNVQIITPIEETIVYLDPPYRNTAEYNAVIDHSILDEFFSSLPYLAFMSEYNAPFKCIHHIETRSTLAQTNTTKRIERLYINQ